MTDKVEAHPEANGYDDGMRFADLWFHLQELKKKMRLQFLQDIKKMIADGASTEELLDRLLKHERARRTTRDLHNMATHNEAAAAIFTYDYLIELCDEYGVPAEYKEHCLFVRPLTPDEVSATEDRRKEFEEVSAGWDEKEREEAKFWKEYPHVAKARWEKERGHGSS